MASSASASSCKPADDDLKLDELVSELHALKKLYGLLRNNSAIPARPDQPTDHVLDEKSRHLLKMLLDGATQQALQSQAKIISCTHEPPKSQAEPNSNISNNDLQKEVRDTQKTQEYHPPAPPEHSPVVAITTPVAQPKITQNLCPTPEPTLPKYRRSKIASVHRSAANDSIRFERSLMSRPSESENRRKSSPQSRNGSRRLLSTGTGGSDRPPSSEKGGEVLTLVPVEKRPRVEPVDLPSPVSIQTHKPGRVDRELTHQKRANRKQPGADLNRIRSLPRTQSSKHQSSRSMTLVGDQMAQIKNDESAEKKTRVRSNRRIKPDRLNSSKANESISDSTCSTGSIPLDLRKQNIMKTRKKIAPPPPPLPLPPPLPPPHPTLSSRVAQRSRRSDLSLRSPRTPIFQNKDQSAETNSRINKPVKPARSNRSRGGRRSSSSTDSTTRSNSVLNRSPRPKLFIPRKQSRVKERGRRKGPPSAAPKTLIPHHLSVSRWQPPSSRPTRTPLAPKLEDDEQGRFKKLTNKLAIIFHHHHHHHHHLHAEEDDEGGEGSRKDHERSLWKYMKGVLHVRKGRSEVQGKLHRYNLRVMMEWFFRHLWWMRQRRRKKVERPRLAKKVKWWEWFRRKGAVVVGGRRRIRLRLGFNGSHRRSAGVKGG